MTQVVLPARFAATSGRRTNRATFACAAPWYHYCVKRTLRLTDAEVAAARYNRAQGEASLACEGIYFSDDEKAVFDRFERERLPHGERRRQLVEFYRQRRRKAARTRG